MSSPDPYMDAEALQLKEEWVRAKLAKDFPSADAVRAQLSAKGVAVDDAWWKAAAPLGGTPRGGGGAARTAAADDAEETEGWKRGWIEAKLARDYPLADRYREALAGKGVRTDDSWWKAAAPLGGPTPAQPLVPQPTTQLPSMLPVLDRPRPVHDGGGALDAEAEQLKQQWIQAKLAKDWSNADMYRDALGRKGIRTDDAWWKIAAPSPGALSRTRAAAPEPPPLLSYPVSACGRWIQVPQQSTGRLYWACPATRQTSWTMPQAGAPAPQYNAADASLTHWGGRLAAPATPRLERLPTVRAPPVPLPSQQSQPALDAGVEELRQAWIDAKLAKNFPDADRYRAQLQERGVRTDDAWWKQAAPLGGGAYTPY